MGSRRRFRPRRRDNERSRDTGTKGERPGGWPSNRVGGQPPRRECEGRGQLRSESSGVDRREKLEREDLWCPYRKPTQVGEASSLR